MAYMHDSDGRLLQALTEQIKLPLLQIARLAELDQQVQGVANSANIRHIAETALSLVDGFLLSTDHQGQELPLESVSISAVLQETAHKLEPLAKRNNCDVELSLHGRYQPVLAHKESLSVALMLLGHGMIEARTPKRQRHRVLLAAHKSSRGLVAGVFDSQPGLSADVFRRGRALYGNARQTMPALGATNGASVFVADALLRSMETPLHVARHEKLTGLAATLHSSSQVQLV